MFHHRSSKFDPRVSAIAGHLRAVEKELGGIGQSAGRRASTGTYAASNHIADAIGPILSNIVDCFSRGQQVAFDQAVSFSDDAINVGARFGNDALEQISTQAKQRPIAALAVAIGVGLLIGFAVRRS
jgi:hypothetical protein